MFCMGVKNDVLTALSAVFPLLEQKKPQSYKGTDLAGSVGVYWKPKHNILPVVQGYSSHPEVLSPLHTGTVTACLLKERTEHLTERSPASQIKSHWSPVGTMCL